MIRAILLLSVFLPSVAFSQGLTQAPFNTLIIYPAHGGTDPGAIGLNGTREKDETLKFAKALQKELTGKESFDVTLVREKDENIPQLLKLTHKAQDLVIIIHTSADTSEMKNGIVITTNPEFSSSTKIKNAFQSNGLSVDVTQKNEIKINQITINIGYITNKNDLMQLRDDSYMTRIAKSLNTIITPLISQ